MKQIAIVVSILFITQSIFAQNFSMQKRNTIDHKIRTIIKQYETLSSFGKDTNFMSIDIQKKFINLFYNDSSTHVIDIIDTDQTLNIRVFDYMQFVKKNFQSGFSVQVKIKEIEYPYLRISKTDYIVNVKVHKKMVGFHKNNYVYSFDKDLWITFRFNKSLNFFRICQIGIIPYEPEPYIPKEDNGNALQISTALPKTIIQHDLSEYSVDISNQPGNSVNFSVVYRQPVFSGISILFGIGNSVYSSSFTLNNYYAEYKSIDADNEEYLRMVSSDIVIEEEEMSFVNFQLGLQYRLPKGKLKPYISTSIVYALPFKSSFTGYGTFDYQGYYPQYNITLYNLSEFNFPENKEVSKSDELSVSNNISVLADLGFEISLSESLNFIIGFNYNKGLSNISNYEKTDLILSNTPDDYSEIMKASTKTTTVSYGLRLGFNIIL